MRARADNGPDMFTAQRRGEPAWYQSVHDLHALQVARGRHDFEQCTVDWQRARPCREVGDARFANELRRRSAGSMWVGVVDTVLWDGKSSTPFRRRARTRGAAR
jgi:hypothetical protein